MTDTDDRIARLEAEIAALKAQLAPPAPVPERPAKPLAWAPQGDGSNVGVNFQGRPSVVPTGDGQVWIKLDPQTGYRKFPDGLLRDDSGAIVPHPIAGVSTERPIGRLHDAKHTEEIEILDRIVGQSERR